MLIASRPSPSPSPAFGAAFRHGISMSSRSFCRYRWISGGPRQPSWMVTMSSGFCGMANPYPNSSSSLDLWP